MPSVFLDRDGTINREVHHLRRVEELVLLDGAAEAIRALNHSAFKVVVVTNQAAIGCGLLSEPALASIHAALREMLARQGAHVDAIYYCPHHPTEAEAPFRVECGCRKPRPGALLRAAAELGLDLRRSFVVGDKLSDLQAGQAAGCRTVLVRTGHGCAAEAGLGAAGERHDHVAADLMEAVQWILTQET